jgi:hypothetical protein
MNMSARIALTSAVAIALATGCSGGRPDPDGGSGGGATGGGNCAPFCAGSGGGTGGGSGVGGGTGGGSGVGGGSGGGSGVGGGSSTFDAGQILKAKQTGFCSVLVQLRGVVVVAVQNTTRQNGMATDPVRQNFWVVEPSNPRQGLYVFKDYADTVGGMVNEPVAVGDVLNLDGFMVSTFNNSGINLGGEAYRYSMQDNCPGTTPLAILRTATGMPLPDLMTPDPFGVNPDGGKPKGITVSDQRFIQNIQGVRVHIPGPLTLSNPRPAEMVRINDNPATGTVFGFEVSGASIPAGVLVRNSFTFALSDGGAGNGSGNPPCDYRQMVEDGGRTVTFPNGIHGVWDTWSQTPCYNGTTSCQFNARDAGRIPGLEVNYTFTVFPLDCNDLAGAVVTP